MLYFIKFLSLIALCSSIELADAVTCRSSVAPNNCCGITPKRQLRIEGGQYTEEYPWMVYYVYSSKWVHCAGSLISSHFVLTAAHCVTEDKGEIIHGVIDVANITNEYLKMFGGDEKNQVIFEYHIVHPGYKKAKEVINDIALSRVSNIQLTGSIMTVCLPKEDLLKTANEYRKSLKLTAAGWGDKRKAIKKKVELPFIEKCGDKPGLICSGKIVGQDTCTGDSGGPVMLRKYNKFHLVGVINSGPKACANGGVNYSVDVFKHRKWILNNARI